MGLDTATLNATIKDVNKFIRRYCMVTNNELTHVFKTFCGYFL
jgi:phage host-nuclease inhibitor protein Gam